jgi:enoyl-CoA hydratase/3-hydroxyacyl-CoA dehydrogenase
VAYTVGARSLSVVGVVGSGQIGPDIALHFAKALAASGVQTVVVDVSDKALQAGQARTWKKIDKGTETGAWKPAVADAIKASLTFTSDYNSLAGADLIVEAATEDEALKGRIFGQIEALVSPSAVLLSNSSHLEPERIFAPLQHKHRTAVAHYFFPAERNVVVEVVRSPDTAPELADWLLQFYESIGKVPIPVQSRYGYAADPVFEGIFAAACLSVEAGLGSIKEVDFAARAALGMTVGPFTAMNLTGGNPITEHGLALMHTRFATPSNPAPWYKVPQLLADKLAADGPTGQWPVAVRGEVVTLEPDQQSRIEQALRGAYLGLTFGIVDSGIITLDDFELCLELALDLKGPCRLANQLGVTEALRLVTAYGQQYPGLPAPKVLADQAASGKPFVPSNLTQRDVHVDGVTVRIVTIRRPKVLNALNGPTYQQILTAVQAAVTDPAVAGVVIAGAGNKAFVSGADIGALAAVQTPQQGYELASLGHAVSRAIETSTKPIVAALTGLAYGGGFELALACHARVALAGHKALVALPEVNLGILPGAGGTQRLPRLIGVQPAANLIRTAGSLSSQQALDLGIVRSLHSWDTVVTAAVQLVADAAAGKAELPRLTEAPLASDITLPAVDIGHRSTAVDAIVADVIAYGATHTLQQGLQAELDGFAKICSLQDMKVGVGHFVQNGTKSPAPFVHA